MKSKLIIHAIIVTVGILLSSIAYADPVWIDVRSLLENKVDNIDGDIRISHTDIVEGVNKLYPDKNTDIRLYCRSGRRAGEALSALNREGYNNVENVGSIGNARKVRSIIKESD